MVIDSDHQECTAPVSSDPSWCGATKSGTAAVTVVSVADDVIKWARVTGDVTVPRADLTIATQTASGWRDRIRGVQTRAQSGLAKHHRRQRSGPLSSARPGSGGTKVTYRWAYPSPGGLLGLLASRQVGQTLTTSLDNLRSIVESEGAQWDSPSRSPDPPAR
jgi:hypothetical protein